MSPAPLWRKTPGGLVFHPSAPPQRRYLASPSPELLFSGHLGNGKSTAAVVKFMIWAQRYPGVAMALARKTFNDLKTSTIRVMGELFPADLWRNGLVGGENAYRLDFPNGSFIDFAGLDRASKFLSTEYALVQIDEAYEITWEDFTAVTGRLRSKTAPISQIGMLTNPRDPEHWMARRYDPNSGSHKVYGECQGDRGRGCKGTACIHCGGTGKALIGEVIVAGFGDNDENLPAAYLRRRAGYKGVTYQRWVRGLWVAFEGAVFGKHWNPDRHVAPNASIPASGRFPDRPAAWDEWNGYPPPDWPRFRALDFGYTNPFVCSWYAEDPEGTLWLYREIYRSGIRTEEHGRHILALEEEELQALRAAPGFQADEARRLWRHLKRLQVDMTPSDHDPEAMATLAGLGIECTLAVKDRPAGRDAVERVLAENSVVFLRNAVVEVDPELVEEQKPTCTADEIPRLRYPAKSVKTVLEESERESPLRKDDHGYSALCYLLLTRERAWSLT